MVFSVVRAHDLRRDSTPRGRARHHVDQCGITESLRESR
jgi:hypothetical protein